MNASLFFQNYWLLIPLLVWTFFWKGIALWKAARRNELGWFTALLILNTVGILEITYVFLIAKKTSPADLEKKTFEETPKRRIV